MADITSDAAFFGVWEPGRGTAPEDSPFAQPRVQRRLTSVEGAVGALNGTLRAPPSWTADDARAAASLGAAGLAAGLRGVPRMGSAVDRSDIAALWWGETDEESMFARWAATAAPEAEQLQDGGTLPFLRQWAGYLRPMCGALAAQAPAALAAQREAMAATAKRSDPPPPIPGSVAYRAGRGGLWCARLPGGGWPGNPVPTRPHSFCVSDGGALSLVPSSLVHSSCLPSRGGHKCPGEYGVSASVPVPAVSDGNAGPGSPEARATAAALAAASGRAAARNLTFLSLVGCDRDEASLTRFVVSQDWWRDVLFSGDTIASVSERDVPSLTEPVADAVSLLIARDPADHANLFHTITMAQSALEALHMAGIVDVSRPTTWRAAKRGLGVVVVDTSPTGPFDGMWHRAFAPSRGALRPLQPEAKAVGKTEPSTAGDGAEALGLLHDGMGTMDTMGPEQLRAFVRPRRVVIPPPAYSSTMFAYVNVPMPTPPRVVRSPVYRALGLWLQQGTLFARGWRADRPGDGDEVWGDGADPGACVVLGSEECHRRVPRGAVRVLLITRRPYSVFVDHRHMARQWRDERAVVRGIATALRLGGAAPVGDAAVPVLPGGAELQVLDAAHLTWDEQAMGLAGTDVLVGVHGAALTAALLLPPWAAVVEVRSKPDEWVCFKHLSYRAGIHYTAHLAQQRIILPNKGGDAAVVDADALGREVALAAMEAAARRLEHVRGARGEWALSGRN